MPQMFVFTAGTPEARQHLADSIESPIDDPQAKVFDNFDEAYHVELERIRDEAGGGFYAWGAVWGVRNLPTWSRWNATISSCASTTPPTATLPGFLPSTITRSARRPSGAPTTRDGPGATCTS